MVLVVAAFGFPRLPGGGAWILVLFALVPMTAGCVTTGLPKYEFRERGVRAWRWFEGWREYPVDAETAVTFRFGDPSGSGYACRLILGADPEDPETMLFRSFRRKDWPRLLEVAVHYSRPRVERKLGELAAGNGTFWVPGVRLDPDGIRYRTGTGGERSLVRYEDIGGIAVGGGAFRLDTRDGTVIEGDAYGANYLAGQVVLEEMLG
jgi:hypothetical protein